MYRNQDVHSHSTSPVGSLVIEQLISRDRTSIFLCSTALVCWRLVAEIACYPLPRRYILVCRAVPILQMQADGATLSGAVGRMWLSLGSLLVRVLSGLSALLSLHHCESDRKSIERPYDGRYYSNCTKRLPSRTLLLPMHCIRLEASFTHTLTGHRYKQSVVEVTQ